MNDALSVRETMQVQQHLSKNVNPSEPFYAPIVGEERFFAFTPVPAGWVDCSGAAINRKVYKDLFAKIGVTHGAGDGSTTFNVPLRARPAGYSCGLKT